MFSRTLRRHFAPTNRRKKGNARFKTTELFKYRVTKVFLKYNIFILNCYKMKTLVSLPELLFFHP